jgi:hypothetical protein
MTCYTFERMPPSLQLTWVLSKGTYLARRWEEDGAIALYYLPDGRRGFFAEVGHNEQEVFVLRSFSSSLLLAEYASRVRLPEG